MQIAKFINCSGVYLISFVVLGGLLYQFIMQQKPCPLCLLQRAAMLFVAIGGSYNLRYTLRTRHYAFALFGCITGSAIALYQVLLHICPTFPPHGKVIFGLELYTWSLLTFFTAMVLIVLVLLIHREETTAHPMNLFEKFSIAILLLAVIINIIFIFKDCRWGLC